MQGESPGSRPGSPSENGAFARPGPACPQVDLPRRRGGVLAARDRRAARYEQRPSQQRQTEDEMAGTLEARCAGECQQSERRATEERARFDQGDEASEKSQHRQSPGPSAATERRHDERKGNDQESGQQIVVPERHRGPRRALAQLFDDRPDRGRGDDRAPGRDAELAAPRGRPAAGDEGREQEVGRQQAEADPAGARHGRGPQAEGDGGDQGADQPATGPAESQRIPPGGRAQERRAEHQRLPRRTGREGGGPREGAAPESETGEENGRQEGHRRAALYRQRSCPVACRAAAIESTAALKASGAPFTAIQANLTRRSK